MASSLLISNPKIGRQRRYLPHLSTGCCCCPVLGILAHAVTVFSLPLASLLHWEVVLAWPRRIKYVVNYSLGYGSGCLTRQHSDSSGPPMLTDRPSRQVQRGDSRQHPCKHAILPTGSYKQVLSSNQVSILRGAIIISTSTRPIFVKFLQLVELWL